MKALVIAAGEGTRMRPLTSGRPKVTLPVANRPILEHLLISLRYAGVEDISVVVGYRREDIESHFGDGSRLGINITYVHQPERRGTGDAVSLASGWSEPFIAVNGDLIVNAEHLRRVVGSKADAVVSVRGVPNPQQMGVVESRDGRVVRIVEKSPEPPSSMANAGIYKFPTEIFDILADCGLSPRGEIEVTDAVNGLVKMGLDVQALPVEGEWFDVGRPWDMLDANETILSRMPSISINETSEIVIEPNVSIHGPLAIGKNTRLRSGTYTEGPVLFGEGYDIGPNCYIRASTSVGDRVRIGNAVEVKNSIVMDDTHIGHLSYVGDSVIGRDCNFGAGTKTANLRLNGNNIPIMVKEDILDSGRRKLGVILGDGVKLGINCSLDCGIMLDAGTCVPPHTLVDRGWNMKTLG